MNDHVYEDDESNSETMDSKLRNRQSHKRISTRLVVISIAFVTIFAGTALVYWFLAPKPTAIQPPISIKEIVDTNSSNSEAQTVIDTSQIEIEELPATEISAQLPTPEYVSDPKILEILNEIQYEFKQTRDALMYFDDRIDSLVLLKPTLDSMIATHADSMENFKSRMLAIEAELQRSLELLQIDDGKKYEDPELGPPFRLIAIDRWENQWNAVIELDGRITMIQPQDSRSGWKLLRLHPTKGSAVFRSGSGNQATLEIN